MQIIRYASAAGAAVAVADGKAIRPLPVRSVAELLIQPRDRLREIMERAGQPLPPRTPARMLPPVDGLTEVWASGVTYERSSTARQEESQVADVYARIYAAQRPELFFKSQAWRVCGPGEPIGIRPDSKFTAPEPELAVVLGSEGRILGFTLANDVSAWDIERENPLYLPQSKIYAGSCALGPVIVTPEELGDPRALQMTCSIERNGARIFSGATSTSRLGRKVETLIDYLLRANPAPAGTVLLTGTGIIVDESAALAPGDVVSISIPQIGELSNPAAIVHSRTAVTSSV